MLWRIVRGLAIAAVVFDFFTPEQGLIQAHAQANDDVSPSVYAHITNLSGSDDVAPGVYAHITNLAGTGSVTPDAFGAKHDTQSVSCTASITSGASTLTCPGAGFTAADVGKYIVVNNAGTPQTTGWVSSMTVTAAGSGYTSMPTVTMSAGGGSGFQGQPFLKAVTATVSTGGSGCTNGTQTFTLSVPSNADFASTSVQFTGTVSAGALSGALTITQAGSIAPIANALPTQTFTVPTTAQSVSGGGCSTAPTVTFTWGLGSVIVQQPGVNWNAGTAAATVSGGGGSGATVSPVVSVSVPPLATTISSFIDSSDVGLAATAGNTLSSAPNTLVVWGHDDSTAIANAMAALPSAGGVLVFSAFNYGLASPITNLAGVPIVYAGQGMGATNIYALAPLSSMLTSGTSAQINGGGVYDLSFRCDKLVTRCLDLAYVRHFKVDHVGVYNGLPQAQNSASALFRLGDGAHNSIENYVSNMHLESNENVSAGGQDSVAYGMDIYATDNHISNVIVKNVQTAHFQVESGANDNMLVATHAYSFPAQVSYTASYGYYLKGISRLINADVDTTGNIAGVDAAVSGQAIAQLYTNYQGSPAVGNWSWCWNVESGVLNVSVVNSNCQGQENAKNAYNFVTTNTSNIAHDNVGAFSFDHTTLVTSAGSGSWTPAQDTSYFTIWACGAGGGGGSGGTGATSSGGGGGGGGGCAFSGAIPRSQIVNLTPIAYTVGTGGSGGTAQGSASSNGNPGNNGTATTFGTLLQASGGGGGAGGATGNTTAAGGGGGGCFGLATNGGTGTIAASGNGGSACSAASGLAGGATGANGGSITAGTGNGIGGAGSGGGGGALAADGKNGGTSSGAAGGGGAGGGINAGTPGGSCGFGGPTRAFNGVPAAGSCGNAPTPALGYYPGAGANGSVAVASGTSATPATPGCGGGGGGSGGSGGTSGAGGAGGNGCLLIVEYH